MSLRIQQLLLDLSDVISLSTSKYSEKVCKPHVLRLIDSEEWWWWQTLRVFLNS